MNPRPLTVLPSLTPAALLEFRLSLHGPLITADRPEYEALRGVWNAAVDVHPLMIVQATDAHDVALTLRFAQHHDLPLAVRSGGHSPAGHGTLEGGIVLDLSRMKALEVDPQSRRVRLEPGLTWGEVAWALHPHGLAISAGDTATVGVGGLTLGGGIGWMVRQFGLAIDRLRAVELVRVGGQVLRASEDQYPELFWGLRGGGGNFGVVTALEFEAHPASTVLGGVVFYDAADAEAVISGYAGYAPTAPDALSTQLLLMAAPPLPFLPAEVVGRPVVGVVVCYNGPLAEGEAALAPLRQLSRPLADVIGPMPYPAILALSEVGERRGFQHHVRSQFLEHLDADRVQTLVRHTLEVLNPGTLVQLRALGGQMARIPSSSTAFAHRDKPFLLMITHLAPASEPAYAARGATEHIWNALRMHGAGTYGNFIALNEEGRVAEVYPQGTLERLSRLKAEHDPNNVFSRNVNIWPALRQLV